MNYDSRNAGEGEIRHTLEWNQSRLYRGSMDWQEDGKVCPVGGLCVSLPEAGGM